MRNTLGQFYDLLYALARTRLFASTANVTHDHLLTHLAVLDAKQLLIEALQRARRVLLIEDTFVFGGTSLPYPLMMAAGFVKGHGFNDEKAALQAVKSGVNIIPGWRSVPSLVGVVEFGSFTRYPRLGNTGVTLWRHTPTRSLQNRIGLKNPGVHAAAAFLGQYQDHLPPTFGVNIAPTPGQSSLEQDIRDCRESVELFLLHGVYPTWFTLNISCPNTEDDPTGKQTQEIAHALTESIATLLVPSRIPLWLKLSPHLSSDQYTILTQICHNTGVKAIIATNTLGMPAPNDTTLTAGMSGAQLRPHMLDALDAIQDTRVMLADAPDLIACGGILDGDSLAMIRARGVLVAQCWSAFIYRGPLALARIMDEYYA